jgi:hypothetical protein
MASAPDGTGGKTASTEKANQSRWRWLKKPVVWAGGLISVVLTAVLVNLATGAASHITAAHGGAAPRIEVDSVTATYLPASPQGVPRAAPVKIDFEIRNTGNQLAIIRGARFTVQQFTALPQCLSQGGLPTTGLYKAFLPTNPASGTTVDIPTAQQVGPDKADRFDVTLGLPVRRPHGIYVYRVRIGLLIDKSRTPADAGEAVIALPFQPDPSYFWTKQDAAHPANVPAFMGSAAIPKLSQCLVTNSHRLGSILAKVGARPAQLTAIRSQLAFCCGWKLSTTVQAQQVCGPAVVRPASMSLVCDGTAALENMKWSAWTASYATGTGMYRLRSCTPSCTQGKVHSYEVIVRFDRPVYSAQDGWRWDRVTFFFPANSPYGQSTIVKNNLVPSQ